MTTYFKSSYATPWPLVFQFGQKIPLPNWRVTFDGLAKLKFLKKYIKNLSFSHAYRSNFTLSNYTTNLNGRFDNQGNATELDMAGNFISEKQIMSMSILEQFSPLIGMDLTLKNEVMVKLEMKKDRNIALSLSNNQITDCLLYTSPSPRDGLLSRMPSSA